ncbi:HIRAN domain-containing protein [Suttonella ornithocola]|uniref:HIRAN domain n=1 Tax=Suttonella ornithocola TaxID=279832 RepID=A0A380MYB0_9GAMM|nr:HIRAN domain-containing protein [Suttonella ornithocola]SUO97204.1 HIRAN domain [Suttonella ornithocola]
MFKKLKQWLTSFSPKPIIAHVPIAGLQYYRAAELSTLMHQGDELSFEHKPNNPHDPDAIMVFWLRNKIGYIPSSHAKCLKNLLQEHQSLYGKIIELDTNTGESRWVKINIYPHPNTLEIKQT